MVLMGCLWSSGLVVEEMKQNAQTVLPGLSATTTNMENDLSEVGFELFLFLSRGNLLPGNLKRHKSTSNYKHKNLCKGLTSEIGGGLVSDLANFFSVQRRQAEAGAGAART